MPTTNTVTIKFSYVDSDLTHCEGSWTGDKTAALSAGVDAVDASVHSNGGWTYYADETCSYWHVPDDEMRRLGAALLAGHKLSACYDLWCSDNSNVEELPGWDE
jgi:hypothetical protein